MTTFLAILFTRVGTYLSRPIFILSRRWSGPPWNM